MKKKKNKLITKDQKKNSHARENTCTFCLTWLFHWQQTKVGQVAEREDKKECMASTSSVLSDQNSMLLVLVLSHHPCKEEDY